MKNAKESKTGKGWWRPIAIATTVILGTGAIALGWLRLRPSPLSSPQEGAEAVPAEAIMALYIEMDASVWGQLQRFGTPEAQASVETLLAEFQQDLAQDTQLDFNRDLKPWIGNVMLALVPNPAGDDEQLLAIVGIRDKIQALAFANRVKGSQDKELQEETYRNTTISTVTMTQQAGDESPQPESYSIAVFGDYLAVGDQPDVVKAAIDTAKDNTSFAREGQMRDLLRSQLVETPLIQAYIADVADLQQLDESASAPAELAEATPGAIVAGLGVTDIGLHLRTLLSVPEDSSLNVPVQPLANSRVNRFPENTLALIEGSHLDQTWTQWTEWVEQTPEGTMLLSELRAAAGQFGIDLDREIFAPLDGTFSLGVVPVAGGRPGLSSTLGVGAMAFIESSDRTTLDASLDKLGTLAQEGFGLPIGIESTTLDSVAITQWTLSVFGVEGETLLGYGWPEANLLALGITRPMLELALTPPTNNLAQQSTFTQIEERFPPSYGGLVFANVEAMRNSLDLVALQTQEVLTPEAVLLLETVQGLGITAASDDDGVSALDIHIPLVLAD
ncbi:MAG: DUF3352 domain-containing protein [Phormidium sp.]|nr:MAG: Protein of unknown function (DUF3352) [Phormidium sp. OSCR]